MKLEMKITDMHCANCALTIEKGLKDLKGITAAAVNLSAARAVVEYDPEFSDPDAIIRQVRKSGYTPEVESLELAVSGMHCTNCGQTVETGVAKLPGVLSVRADAVSGRVNVLFDPTRLRAGKIRTAVDRLGYKVESMTSGARGS